MPTPPNLVKRNSSPGRQPAGVVQARPGLQPARQGFTLVVTLVILAAVTILVVGLYSIVQRESQTSASYDAVDQADLAIQSGLDHAGVLLKEALADELGVMFSAPLNPSSDDKGRPREMLVAANFDAANKQWKYQPLASGVAQPPAGDKLAMPAAGFEKIPSTDKEVGASVEENEIAARKLPVPAPWASRVPRFWTEIRLPADQGGAAPEGGEEGTEEEEKVVARYSFYIEDLQSKLSLANVGIHDRDSNRPYYKADLIDEVTPVEDAPPVIPGLYIEPNARWRRSPVSLWTLLRPNLEPVDSGTSPASASSMHQRLTAVNSKRLAFSPDMWRELMLTPDATTNWQGINSSLLSGNEARLPSGSLMDAQMRALEENTTGYLEGYDELALVPHMPGVSFGGERKLNLNRVLNDAGANEGATRHSDGVDAVQAIADHIHRHLPRFGQRAGGYPLPRDSAMNQRDKHQMAYLKCLAAGMVDYADKDGMPSMNIEYGGAGDEGVENRIEYRGSDAYPLINEYWQRHRFVQFQGRKVKCSLTDYVELWNPTNQPITGTISCCFEYKGRFWVGVESYQVMSAVKGSEVESGKPQQIPGLQGLWFAPQAITLQPNEIKVVAFEPVVFLLDGAEVGNVTGVQYYGQPANGNDDRESRYRLAFNPGGSNSSYVIVDKPFAPLERYQMSCSINNPQRFNVNQPGLSYRVRDTDWAFNVGDTRAAFFIDYNQEVIDYDDGSSPWGRNFRRFDRMAGEVRTFLWPDGGHNSLPCPTKIADFKRNPDDITLRPPVNPSNSLQERQKFVQRISNVGRFYSMTELGHIFDPIMWCPRGSDWSEAGRPASYDIRYEEHADLRAEKFSVEDPRSSELDGHRRFCGGNSLRIGRVEHSLFRPDYRAKPDQNRPLHRGMTATSLLDVLHCGDANATDATRVNGPLVRIDGHVNINTASKETLRALVAGRLSADPLAQKDSQSGSSPGMLLPSTTSRTEAQADIIATAIIDNRPYITAAEVADKAVVSPDLAAKAQPHAELLPVAENVPAFGYTERDEKDDRMVKPQWSDAAAEEVFARLWNNSTVRSRHFQIVVVGQTVKKGRMGTDNVVSTRARLYHVFVRPVRAADGTLQRQDLEITYSRAL